jgi:2-aminoethylphosphonate-pyruvate transaminase
VADSFRIGCIGRVGAAEMRGVLAAIGEILDAMRVTDRGPAGRRGHAGERRVDT